MLVYRRSFSARARRALAVLTALSCFWLSAIGSVFHHHAYINTQENGQSVITGTAHTPYAAVAKSQQPGDLSPCLACEWQANSVSVALPSFEVPQPQASADEAISSTSSYIRLLAFDSPSRAPPAA